MKKITKLILTMLTLFSLSFAEDRIINQSQFENKTIFIDTNSYKILQFNKQIKDIQITNSENILIEILENLKNPLTRLKVYAKQPSNESAIITFQDSTIITVGFNIVPHLKNLIRLVEETYTNVEVEQINDTIFLKGSVDNQKDKAKILDMFAKFDIDPETKVVDMLSTSNPKMIRIKLYAVEINNNKGLDIKNNWYTSSKNYMTVTDGDTYQNYALSSYGRPTVQRDVYASDGSGTVIGKVDVAVVNSTSDYQNANNQRNILVSDEIDNLMADAVSLTGGLTGAANFLGKYFNAGLTLQYLAGEGVANILDETTLITLENKEAVFRAGGEFYVRLTGEKKVELRTIEYGLELKITAKEVMNDEYVHLTINTKARELDWTNAVDDIPSITNKSIDTTVIIKDKATVILGGLVNSKNTKDSEKIPLLGDIPVIGFIFKSSSYKEGSNELVFFITPEIVKASSNNQTDILKENKNNMFVKQKKETKEKYLDMLNINFMKDTNKKSLILEEKKPIKEKVKKEISISKIPKEKIEVQLKELIKTEEEPKIIETKTLKKEETSTFKNLFRQTKNTFSKKINEQERKQRVNKILGYE